MRFERVVSFYWNHIVLPAKTKFHDSAAISSIVPLSLRTDPGHKPEHMVIGATLTTLSFLCVSVMSALGKVAGSVTGCFVQQCLSRPPSRQQPATRCRSMGLSQGKYRIVWQQTDFSNSGSAADFFQVTAFSQHVCNAEEIAAFARLTDDSLVNWAVTRRKIFQHHRQFAAVHHRRQQNLLAAFAHAPFDATFAEDCE